MIFLLCIGQIAARILNAIINTTFQKDIDNLKDIKTVLIKC